MCSSDLFENYQDKLESNYQFLVADVEELIEIEDAKVYTKQLQAILEGTYNSSKREVIYNSDMEHMLPEEYDYLNENELVQTDGSNDVLKNVSANEIEQDVTEIEVYEIKIEQD